MRARHTDLLTPLECAVPRSILISILGARINPLESALTSHSQLTENTATLSLLECALTRLSPVTPLESALTKTPGVGVPPKLASTGKTQGRASFDKPLCFHAFAHALPRRQHRRSFLFN